MKYTAIINDERLEVDVTRIDTRTIAAEVNGQKYVLDADAFEAGLYWFNWNNRSFEVSVTPNRDRYDVSVSGVRLSVEILDARSALRKASQQSHTGAVELRAPMPGKVVKVLVKEGDAVEANQGLMVVEAMKMQNEIKAPKRGVVRKLGVKEAAAVNAGDLLVVVE
jgi:biotin carboxyl carrier protein